MNNDLPQHDMPDSSLKSTPVEQTAVQLRDARLMAIVACILSIPFVLLGVGRLAFAGMDATTIDLIVLVSVPSAFAWLYLLVRKNYKRSMILAFTGPSIFCVGFAALFFWGMGQVPTH